MPGTKQPNICSGKGRATLRIGQFVIEMQIVLRSAQHALPLITLPNFQFHCGRDEPIVKEFGLALRRRGAF